MSEKETLKAKIMKALIDSKPSKLKPTTIAELYDILEFQQIDSCFNDNQIYYDYLRELQGENKIHFINTANETPIILLNQFDSIKFPSKQY